MHKDVFPDLTPDKVWIPQVTARGWIIVTRDKRMQKRPMEWAALIRAKARVLWFRGDHASDVEITEGFLAALPRIDKLAAMLTPPYVIRVTPAGYAYQKYPKPVERDDKDEDA